MCCVWMITQAGFSRAAVYRWGRVPGLSSDGDFDIWKTPGSCNRWYLDQFSPLRWHCLFFASRIDGFRENSMYLLFWSSCFIFHCMISLIQSWLPFLSASGDHDFSFLSLQESDWNSGCIFLYNCLQNFEQIIRHILIYTNCWELKSVGMGK
jgi:hypothetical protein